MNTSSESAKVALAYIESLTTRFENAERHINEDINTIEKRLGQLVELTGSVSSIQHQMTHQQQIFTEIRASMRSNIAQVDELVNGVDSRYSSHFDTIKRKISDVAVTEADARKKVDTRLSSVERNIRTWLNRGIGGWAVIVLVFGFFQFAGMQYLDGLHAERDAFQAAITKLTSKVNDLELRQQTVEDIRIRVPSLNPDEAP